MAAWHVLIEVSQILPVDSCETEYRHVMLGMVKVGQGWVNPLDRRAQWLLMAGLGDYVMFW